MGITRRLSPFAIWLGLCVILGGVTLTEQSLQRRWQSLQAARATYTLAIADTQLNLSQMMARVGGDAALAQNLKWKLSHSVKAALSGMLEKGQLDLIALYAPGCIEVGRAGSSAITVQCPGAATRSTKAKTFHWLSTPGTTALALVSPLDGTEVNLVAAVGAVTLDDQWLGAQPGLKAAIQELDLRFGQSGGIALVEPINTPGGAAATLRSDNLYDKLIYSAAVQRWFFSTSLIWPCLLLTLGWGLFVLWRQADIVRTTNAQISTFTGWCRSLATSSAAILPASAASADGIRELNLGLPQSRQLVTHAIKVKSETIQGLRDKRQALEHQLKGREETLQKLTSRLSELAELDSLAVQLKRTTAIFLKRMDALHSDADDLDQITAQAIAGESDQLLRLASDWKLGIAERGARKFIRSLAETPHTAALNPVEGTVAAEAAPSELEAQLELYYQHSLQLSDLAVNAGRITDQIVQAAAFAARLAALWHGLALKSHDTERCEGLLAPLEEAQALVLLEPELRATHFINPQAEDLERDLPAVPKHIWVSSLYHVYLALAELAKGEGVQVATRIRSGGPKVMLAIQVSAPTGKPLPQRSDKQAYHLEISRSMLAPFHISLSVLPAVDGPYPIVLSWSQPGSEIDLVPPREQGQGYAPDAAAMDTGV